MKQEEQRHEERMSIGDVRSLSNLQTIRRLSTLCFSFNSKDVFLYQLKADERQKQLYFVYILYVCVLFLYQLF